MKSPETKLRKMNDILLHMEFSLQYINSFMCTYVANVM